MIQETCEYLRVHRSERRAVDACIAGVRLQALLDAYEAIGGSAAPWRNSVGVLRRDL